MNANHPVRSGHLILTACMALGVLLAATAGQSLAGPVRQHSAGAAASLAALQTLKLEPAQHPARGATSPSAAAALYVALATQQSDQIAHVNARPGTRPHTYTVTLELHGSISQFQTYIASADQIGTIVDLTYQQPTLTLTVSGNLDDGK